MSTKDIGKKLRNYRKEKNITLAELSEKTELSIGYLSNLERDISSPTLDNIQKICEVLGISLIKLLEEEYNENYIIRRSERQVIFEIENQIRYEAIKFGSNSLEGLIITTFPNCHYDKKWRHNYDEIGLVTEGQLTLIIDKEEFILNKGDSFYIKANTQHSLCNKTDILCESYWVKISNDQNY